MKNEVSRFALVIRPPDYNAADLVKILSASDPIPLHVMSYDQWAPGAFDEDLDLLIVRRDGSLRYFPARSDRSSLATELGARDAAERADA